MSLSWLVCELCSGLRCACRWEWLRWGTSPGWLLLRRCWQWFQGGPGREFLAVIPGMSSQGFQGSVKLAQWLMG